MAKLQLFINTSNNTLVPALKASSTVDAKSLPFFYGDTLNLDVYLLEKPAGYNPSDPNNSALSSVSTAGLQLFLYIDDGTVGGTIYTQQIVWVADPTNTFFSAALALNTAALATLLGAQTNATAWLKIGYSLNGQQTTVFSAQITIGVGLPSAAVPAVPAGQTALSAEVAAATYWPLQPVKGQPLYIESPNGKILALIAIDNADGTASPQFSPVN